MPPYMDLTTAGKAYQEAVPIKKKSHLSLVKQLVLTSELLLGFKVEMNEAIHTSHKTILFHFPVELDRQPCIYLHLEVFFVTVQG